MMDMMNNQGPFLKGKDIDLQMIYDQEKSVCGTKNIRCALKRERLFSEVSIDWNEESLTVLHLV